MKLIGSIVNITFARSMTMPVVLLSSRPGATVKVLRHESNIVTGRHSASTRVRWIEERASLLDKA
jgi:hypothetical protein